jgi:hypothetical protein
VRTHLSLGKDAPEHRATHPPDLDQLRQSYIVAFCITSTCERLHSMTKIETWLSP